MRYTLRTRVRTTFDETVDAVRAALDEQAFGVLTEIDVRTTMREKLAIDVPAQVILGACRPTLAYAAMQADPSIATILPCNVVVRETDDRTVVVEAMDPGVMLTLVDSAALREVAVEAHDRLLAALESLDTPVPAY